tara:strand:- start:288 stop:662 length:375 start_codon:yes stop_codon:yes gene_type:complete
MANLNGLELGLLIAVSILGLILIIIIMYYLVIGKTIGNISGSAKSIFMAFTRLKNTDDQIKIMQDVETYLIQKKDKLKEQENSINSVVENNSGYTDVREPEASEPEYSREKGPDDYYDDSLLER